MNKGRLRSIAFGAAIAVCSTSTFAASTTGCVVETVGYDGSPRIAIWCSQGQPIHYAFGDAWSDCKNAGLSVSTDTIKVWQSMLQSALLSGRKVDLDYSSKAGCQGGARAITAIRLQRQ